MKLIRFNHFRIAFLILFILPGIYLGGYCKDIIDREKPIIYVSIPPLAYFVNRIGGDDFDCRILIGPGQSPATYEATPKKLAELSEADVLFTIGVPFEKQLIKKVKATFQKLNIVNAQAGIELIHTSHRHDDADTDNKTEELDPHTWLDPILAKIIAKNIYDEIERIYPGNNNHLSNFNKLITDLEKLNEQISSQLLPLKGKTFYTFHPALGYFGRAYGLIQQSIEIDGKEPTARQMANLIEKAKAERARALFIQPQFSQKTAQFIAEAIGARLILVDPLAEDYLDNLKEIARQLVLAFEDSNE